MVYPTHVKPCKACGYDKSLTEYSDSSWHNGDGRDWVCRECRGAARLQREERNGATYPALLRVINGGRTTRP